MDLRKFGKKQILQGTILLLLICITRNQKHSLLQTYFFILFKAYFMGHDLPTLKPNFKTIPDRFSSQWRLV